MSVHSYVLVTPVRNEEATIGITIESVAAQTLPPVEWVLVSDRSTDCTDGIIRRYQSVFPFIRLLCFEGGPERSFSSVVHATEAGITALQSKSYEFLGLLDADVRFTPNYYETLISRFESNPKLGLAGGLVLDVINGKARKTRQYLQAVAGATQFFRRACFDSLGGLVPIPEGGWDAITCVQARANGYDTSTFPDLIIEHLKPRSASEGNLLRRNWHVGLRDYALGNHPLFEVFKCGVLSFQRPFLIGAAVRLGGFIHCVALRKKRVISGDIIDTIRREQLNRMRASLFTNLEQRGR